MAHQTSFQCQAKLSSGKRCPHRATGGVFIKGSRTAYLCGHHGKQALAEGWRKKYQTVKTKEGYLQMVLTKPKHNPSDDIEVREKEGGIRVDPETGKEYLQIPGPHAGDVWAVSHQLAQGALGIALRKAGIVGTKRPRWPGIWFDFTVIRGSHDAEGIYRWTLASVENPEFHLSLDNGQFFVYAGTLMIRVSRAGGDPLNLRVPARLRPPKGTESSNPSRGGKEKWAIDVRFANGETDSFDVMARGEEDAVEIGRAEAVSESGSGRIAHIQATPWSAIGGFEGGRPKGFGPKSHGHRMSEEGEERRMRRNDRPTATSPLEVRRRGNVEYHLHAPGTTGRSDRWSIELWDVTGEPPLNPMKTFFFDTRTEAHEFLDTRVPRTAGVGARRNDPDDPDAGTEGSNPHGMRRNDRPTATSPLEVRRRGNVEYHLHAPGTTGRSDRWSIELWDVTGEPPLNPMKTFFFDTRTEAHEFLDTRVPRTAGVGARRNDPPDSRIWTERGLAHIVHVHETPKGYRVEVWKDLGTGSKQTTPEYVNTNFGPDDEQAAIKWAKRMISHTMAGRAARHRTPPRTYKTEEEFFEAEGIPVEDRGTAYIRGRRAEPEEAEIADENPRHRRRRVLVIDGLILHHAKGALAELKLLDPDNTFTIVQQDDTYTVQATENLAPGVNDRFWRIMGRDFHKPGVYENPHEENPPGEPSAADELAVEDGD